MLNYPYFAVFLLQLTAEPICPTIKGGDLRPVVYHLPELLLIVTVARQNSRQSFPETLSEVSRVRECFALGATYVPEFHKLRPSRAFSSGEFCLPDEAHNVEGASLRLPPAFIRERVLDPLKVFLYLVR